MGLYLESIEFDSEQFQSFIDRIELSEMDRTSKSSIDNEFWCVLCVVTLFEHKKVKNEFLFKNEEWW